MDRLFVAYKPSNIGSNQYLSRLKRKYNAAKAGFSGTLDPFAKGVLIVAFGKYTSLFRFLNKTPKRYRATLWLGAHSDSLDIEIVKQIDTLDALDEDRVKKAIYSLEGELEYHPPIFSAKKIDGRRAYDLAREGKEVKLNTIHSTIYEMKFLHYCHPFVTFEATVSEGTYIRSLGRLIADKLGVEGGCLSALERLNEGQFHFEQEKALDIKKCLNMPQNVYTRERSSILLGQKLLREDFEVTENGTYWVDNGESISIFEFDDEGVRYLLNRVSLHEEL
ncbi:MAG: tRNA pseudouridine(55) synthase TruB [Helicobacteraceae bacterium]|nr:tRNA pseudouridine(55) synthase TruB [Helicobacteraceae bacterium]